MKLIDKIFTYTMNILLVVSTICVCSLCYTTITTGVSSIFGYKPLLVVTGSMEPVIHEKSLVLAKTVNAKNIEVGDIVAYECYDKTHRGITIVHRVIRIEGNKYYFKGDANKEEDPPVLPKQIKYKVIMM